MSELEQVPLDWGEPDEAQPRLFLYRKPNPRRPAVLLLHGLTSRHEMYLLPEALVPNQPRCLVDWLHRKRFEPWLLDWRASGKVVDALSPEELEALEDRFDFDRAARLDIPLALAAIERETRTPCERAVAHCMGAASLAEAIALGKVRGLRHVVLLTIGLFYEPAWDGRIKSQDHVLERVRGDEPGRTIDPRPGAPAWPDELEDIYDHWPDSLRLHPQKDPPAVDEMCNRLGLMFGAPYLEEQLAREIHERGLLLDQFGALPIKLYVHAAQNIRRGWAAEFEADAENVELIGERARAHFDALRSITLLTGQRNQVWHRESIDRMHEWLTRGTKQATPRVVKEIVPDYAHQDLLWGQHARRDVFPLIRKGLGPAGVPDQGESLPPGEITAREPERGSGR